MPFDCPICGKDCRDNYNLGRHMKNKHYGDSSDQGSSAELRDPRLMLEAEENEYLFNHPYYREKDGKLYETQLKEAQFKKNILLKEQWKLKSGKQIGIDKKKIDEEYGLDSDEELDETSEAYMERLKKLSIIEYQGSYTELNKIQDELDMYKSNLFENNKILESDRIRKVKNFVRTRIINELEAKDAAEEAIKKKAELEAAREDKMRRELQLKMELAMMKFKK